VTRERVQRTVLREHGLTRERPRGCRFLPRWASPVRPSRTRPTRSARTESAPLKKTNHNPPPSATSLFAHPRNECEAQRRRRNSSPTLLASRTTRLPITIARLLSTRTESRAWPSARRVQPSARRTVAPLGSVYASPLRAASACEAYATWPCVGSGPTKKSKPSRKDAPAYVWASANELPHACAPRPAGAATRAAGGGGGVARRAGASRATLGRLEERRESSGLESRLWR